MWTFNLDKCTPCWFEPPTLIHRYMYIDTAASSHLHTHTMYPVRTLHTHTLCTPSGPYTHTHTLCTPTLSWTSHTSRPSPSPHTHTQINKRGKVQERALLITDIEIFKLDPRKQFQRKKSPLLLTTITGISVSPSLDQGMIIHFENRKDLVFYIVNPLKENRVAELLAVLCQICQRWERCSYHTCTYLH